MSHLSSECIDRFNRIGDHVREELGFRGYSAVEAALEADRAFRNSSAPRTALTREVIAAAVAAGANLEGIYFERKPNRAVELTFTDGGRQANVRLRMAQRTADGAFVVPHNAASTWGSEDEAVLFPEEPWVLGYRLDDNNMLADLFLAHALGVTAGRPGRLILGAPILLAGSGGRDPFGGRFYAPDEGLDDGFEEWGEDVG